MISDSETEPSHKSESDFAPDLEVSELDNNYDEITGDGVDPEFRRNRVGYH